MKYYTVETVAMSIDPNRDYTTEEIAGLYRDYLSNLDGTVEFYRDIDAALARYKEIDNGVININRGSATILVVTEVYGWEVPWGVPLGIDEGDIRDPAGFRGHPTDLDIECLGVIKPQDTVKRIHTWLNLYKQRKAGK